MGVAARIPPNTIDAVRATFEDMSPVGKDLCAEDTGEFVHLCELAKAAFTFFLRFTNGSGRLSVEGSNVSRVRLLSKPM